MLKKLLIALLATPMLTSCFKAEPLNNEADLLEVSVNVANPSSVFFNETDVTQLVPYSGNDGKVVFDVKSGSDYSDVTLDFKISEGATIDYTPGTKVDFSDGQPHYYTVTSQDGDWKRIYSITFNPVKTTHVSSKIYSLDDGHLNEKGKFYIWGDGLCTANEGFSVARGGAKPDEYPTIYDENGYKGGCAILRTVSTGSWGAMAGKRLAAGNLFLGTFDITKALTQTLRSTHFGIPVSQKPVKYCGYYKYQAGEKFLDAKGKEVAGEIDSCSIYAVVYKNHDADGNEIYLTGEDVMTNPNLVAVARFHNIPQTNAWTRFEVDFKYTSDIDPKLLENRGYSMAIVGSSSHLGDYYSGAIGSSLWLDELEVVYEYEE